MVYTPADIAAALSAQKTDVVVRALALRLAEPYARGEGEGVVVQSPHYLGMPPTTPRARLTPVSVSVSSHVTFEAIKAAIGSSGVGGREFREGVDLCDDWEDLEAVVEVVRRVACPP